MHEQPAFAIEIDNPKVGINDPNGSLNVGRECRVCSNSKGFGVYAYQPVRQAVLQGPVG